METLFKDIRCGLRLFARNPGFTAVALLALTLGISANTTVFSAIDATLFHAFAFPNQDRLVMLWERSTELGFTRGSVSPANLNDWQEQNQTLEQAIPVDLGYFDITERDEPERVLGNKVGSAFFGALGVRALYGRTFVPDEGQPGREQVVVLKYSLWQRRFGGDPSVINQTIRLNGQSYTVIGVMPPDFNFPFRGGELWAPLVFRARELVDRHPHYLNAIGLLKPGVTIEQARKDLNAIAARAAEQFPETNAGLGVNVVSLTADATRGSRMYAPIMLATVALVLLIACTNVANLLLVRGASRQKEIAIRMAMGAGRFRLVRQLLTESLMLSLAGGALGLLVSIWGIDALARSVPDEFNKFIPGWHNLVINQTALVFTLAASVLTGLLFGTLPAIHATKTNLNEALKEGGRGGSGKASRNRARSALVVAEVALSLTLLIAAGLMIRSFVEMLRSDFGVDPANVLTMQISLQDKRYAEQEMRNNSYDQVLRGIEVLPGVTGAGGVGNLPMSGSSNGSSLERIGQTVFAQGKQPLVVYAPITPGYLEAMGTRLIKGRNFTEQDTKDAPRVALVNQTFVRSFLGDQEPIGQTFQQPHGTAVSIVGVTVDVMNEDFDERRHAQIYVPYSQDTWLSMYLVIRGSSDPALLAAAVRGEVNAMDKTLPVFNVKAMEQMISERMSPKRLATAMLGVFAFIALALAAVGIYAVMSYVVSQRTREIGIRVALGARPADIFRLIVGQGMALTLIGVVIGLAGAFGLGRSLSALLYGVTGTDPLTFAGITLLLGGVALVACCVPTRRATKVDPMVALRCE